MSVHSIRGEECCLRRSDGSRLRESELLQQLNVTSGNTWTNWYALTHTYYIPDIAPKYLQSRKGLQSQIDKIPFNTEKAIQSQKHKKMDSSLLLKCGCL